MAATNVMLDEAESEDGEGEALLGMVTWSRREGRSPRTVHGARGGRCRGGVVPSDAARGAGDAVDGREEWRGSREEGPGRCVLQRNNHSGGGAGIQPPAPRREYPHGRMDVRASGSAGRI
jgi:hypothetical protein